MSKVDEIEAKLANNEALDHFSKHEIVALIQYVRAAEAKYKVEHELKMQRATLFDFQEKLNEFLFARKRLKLEP